MSDAPSPSSSVSPSVRVTDVSGADGAAGAIRVVTIDRPSAMNAIDPATMTALLDAFADARRASNQNLRVVILTGAGNRAFAAGADIVALAGMGPAEARAFSMLGHQVADAIEMLPVPVIAAVNGVALGGGCEMAMACDFIFAAASARFGQPEVKLGAIPGFGGTKRLPRRIGIARAREWLYTAVIVDAQEAQRIGLVNRVFPGVDELMAGTLAVAKQIAAQAPLAVAQAKLALLRSSAGDAAEASDAADRGPPDECPLESELFAELFASADLRAGIRAFLDKDTTPVRWERR